MTQDNFFVFGEKSKFAIEVNLLQETPLLSLWATSITKEDRALFSVSPFIAEKFLSCMSTAWGRFFLEQTYPFSCEKTVFNPQHFIFINQENKEKLTSVQSFEKAHNIGRWLDDSVEIYFMRQGEFIDLTWDRKVFPFPLAYIMNIFTGLGDFLATQVPEYCKKLWNERENIGTEFFLTYASGISETNDRLRDFISQQISFSFRDLIADHPYLAIARMSQSANFDSNDALIAIKAIQAIQLDSRTKNSEKSEILLPGWVKNIPYDATNPYLEPYEQAYVLASHVRKSIETLQPSTKNINIYSLLSSLGYEVFEKELPRSVHALSIWYSNVEQFVVLNTSDNALGLSKNYLHRAAMAHELCHILLDTDRSRPLVDLMLINMDDPIEKRARAFAAELLLPRKLAMRFIAEREDKLETVDLMAWKYEVSLSIAANQLVNGAYLQKEKLPPNILEYVNSIQSRAYYYNDSDAKLSTLINEIQSLKELQQGWYEGVGKVPPQNGLDWLIGNIEGSFHPQTLIVPGIFPTPEGGVQLEWDLGNYQGILEFDLEEKKANWLMFSIDKLEHGVEREIDLSVAAGWSSLVDCIIELMEEATND